MSSLPQSIENILTRTSVGNHSQQEEMGYLFGKISPKQFQDFIIEFCAGIAGIYNKLGVSPKNIIIEDGDNSDRRFSYDSDRETIIIFRSAIDFFCNNSEQDFSCPMSESHQMLVTKTEYVIMAGIEEAYHHYQLTKKRDQYSLSGSHGLNAEEYINHPVERDARIYIQYLVQDFGFHGRFHVAISGSNLQYSTFSSCEINPEIKKFNMADCPCTQWHLLINARNR
jgi:hypothetical protein